MSGCLAENTLVEFVEGRLNAAATASLHRHVDACTACRALLREVGGAFFQDAAPPAADHASLSLALGEPSVAPSRASTREGEGGAPSRASTREGVRRSRKVALRPGDRVGKYRIVRQVGVGGMGVVFEALHEQLRRRVAVKVLYPHYAENPQMVARLLNEARAANIVRHPAIVSSFEVGHLPTGEAYLVMEYLDGEPLRLRMCRLGGRLGPSGVRILRQVASALSAAHGWGVIHRDLKPANVMLVPDPEMAGGERVKILDFGLAKVGAELREEGEEGDEYSTHAGAILGTPAYMAPEQCQEAAAVDEKADVYSLGVMLYEATSGRLPFSAKGAVDLMAMHIYVPAPPLREVAPEAPAALVTLVGRMLSKAAADRPSMAEVAAELERIESAGDERPAPPTLPLPRQRSRRWLLPAAGAPGLGLTLWLGYAATAPTPPPSPAPALAAARRPALQRPAPPVSRPPLPPAPAVQPPAVRPASPARRPPRREAAEVRARRPAHPTPPPPAEEWTDEKIRIFQ